VLLRDRPSAPALVRVLDRRVRPGEDLSYLLRLSEVSLDEMIGPPEDRAREYDGDRSQYDSCAFGVDREEPNVAGDGDRPRPR
jgi:hypothetical protein